MVHDPLVALETLISLGFERVLTSGCDSSALEGLSLIKRLAEQVSVCCVPLGYCGCSLALPAGSCSMASLIPGKDFCQGVLAFPLLLGFHLFPRVHVGWAPKSPTAKTVWVLACRFRAGGGIWFQSWCNEPMQTAE